MSCSRCEALNQSQICYLCQEEYCESCSLFCEHGSLLGRDCTACPECNQLVTLCYGITICQEHEESAQISYCVSHRSPSLGESDTCSLLPDAVMAWSV